MSHNEFYVTPKVRLRQHWSWTEIELHVRALRTALDYWSWCPVSPDSTEFSMTHTLVLYFHRIEGYLELRQEDFLICWEVTEAFSDPNFSFDSFHDSIHEDLPKVSSAENSNLKGFKEFCRENRVKRKWKVISENGRSRGNIQSTGYFDSKIQP